MKVDRSGITRVEVAVIVACLIIVAAMLFPSMLGPRPHWPSREVQCRNSLKNLALANANYETTKKRFPGLIEQFGSINGTSKVGSWFVALMPVLEQQELRDLWDDTNTTAIFLEGRDMDQFYPQISLVMCPSDVSQGDERTSSSYAVNVGFMPVFPTAVSTAKNLGYSGPGSVLQGAETSADSTRSQRVANGVFVNRVLESWGFSDSVSSDQIVDGLSNTIAFAENMQTSGWDYFALHDDSTRWNLGVAWFYALKDPRETNNQAGPALDFKELDAKETFLPGHRQFEVEKSHIFSARPSALHDNAFYAAMLDGSVRSLSIDIDYKVYQSLMTPDTRNSDAPCPDYVLKPADWLK